MEKWPGFEQKTPEELEEQVKKTSESLGAEVAPPSEEELVEMSLGEIKDKYPRRYEIYLENLRAERREDVIDEPEKEKMAKWLTTLNNLDGYIEKHKSDNEEEQTLRERQFTVFEDLRESLEQGENTGYIKLPTGVGKTVLFSEFIEATKLKTLVVVPTKILIGQTEEKLKQFAPELEVAKYFSEEKESKGDVQITTYQSLVRQSQKEKADINANDYDLLILDEAHKALSEKAAEQIRQSKNLIKIGLTATPKYDEKKSLKNLLGNEIHSMEVKEAIQEGLLSSCRVIIPETEVDLTNIKVIGGEYNQEELEKAINVETRNKASVELYKKAFNGKSGITFAGGVNHANTLKEMFNKDGVSAEVVTGKTPPKEREGILKNYKEGKIKMLIGAQVFIEGFDEPKASVCFNLAPTLSKVVAEQRAGRVLRLDDSNTNKKAFVVDFLDKNDNKRIAPISFAEILGGADIRNPNIKSGNSMGMGDPSERDISRVLSDLKIEGLDVIVDPKEVMAVVQKNLEEKSEAAPEGWLTLNALSEFLEKDPETIENIADKFIGSNPDWSKEYKTNTGVHNHYSPELIAKITQTIKEQKSAPEGWMLQSQIVELLKRSPNTISRLLPDLENTYPDGTGLYMAKTGMRKYYSPEIIEALKRSFESWGGRGWANASQIAESLGKTHETITRLADDFRTTHSEWFREMPNDRGRIFEYYSPELIVEIKKVIESSRQAPDGWMTARAVADNLGISSVKVENITNRFRDSHPEWVDKFSSTKVGSNIEYYSPELISEITKIVSQHEKAPEGWMTNSGLKNAISQTQYKIGIIAGQFRESHPEWFEKYIDAVGKLAEHYSPELIREIQRTLSLQESAPPGWVVAPGLAEGLGINKITALNLANQFRQSHPEWFRDYLSQSGRFIQHYSPELVSEVVRIMKEKNAPEGWITNTAIADQLNVKIDVTKKIANEFRNSNPEWFKEYESRNGRLYEYYSPELVKEIVKRIER